jgi:hypothetical protein
MFRNLLFTSVALMLSGPVYAQQSIDDASVPGSAPLAAADNVTKLAGCFAVTLSVCGGWEPRSLQRGVWPGQAHQGVGSQRA